MAVWQRVDTDTLNKPRPLTIRGVDVTVYFGQDDMPVGVRGNYDEVRKKFVIEFRYDVADEPIKRVPVEDGRVELVVGQASDRLFQMEFDIDSKAISSVRLLLPRVEHVLSDLAKGAPKGLNRIDNYVAASGAFKQVKPQLETALAQ